MRMRMIKSGLILPIRLRRGMLSTGNSQLRLRLTGLVGDLAGAR